VTAGLAIADLLENIDENPKLGVPIGALLRAARSADPAHRRVIEAIQALALPADARIVTEALPSQAADPPLVAVVFVPRDVTGGPAVATIVTLGYILRQPGPLA
jgi:hypothetical protein